MRLPRRLRQPHADREPRGFLLPLGSGPSPRAVQDLYPLNCARHLAVSSERDHIDVVVMVLSCVEVEMAGSAPDYESALTPEIRALIGLEGVPAVHEITAAGIRAFARAVGLSDPVFYDRTDAKRRGYPDLPAPPGYFGFPVFAPTRSDPLMSWPLGQQGTVSHPFMLIPSRHTNGLAAGSETEYLSDAVLSAGDVLTSVTRLENVTERYSQALGGPMLIQTTATLFRKNDTPIAIYRFTLISYTPQAKE